MWARRALPAGPGWSPAPPCLFVPFASAVAAASFARAVAGLGWRVWVRPGASGSPVWSAAGLPVPVCAVKVALPSGVSSAAARARLSGLLPSVPRLGALAWAL